MKNVQNQADKPQEKTPDALPTFDKKALVGQARRLFNTSPDVVAGALYDVTEPITIDQAAKKVKAFLTRPIRKEGGK